MANSINWGRIYCFTEFGDEDFTIAESIPSFSAPACFLDSIDFGQNPDQIETLAITSDDIRYKSDSTILTADKSLV